MTLPANVRVEAAPNFLHNLEAARQFFTAQDADSAVERFRKLRADLREMIAVLAWSPASGRPARFLAGRSAQARLRSDAVQQLAAQAGLPQLREYVIGRHLVLYAHSDTEVVLLELKHQRQLMYSAED
ncbi:MAG: hypothetical protein H6R10_3556 [Rhodocyclaceae bacterium]|nr:hypothetical protein [Rhodocyclaceae bacterium]